MSAGQRRSELTAGLVESELMLASNLGATPTAMLAHSTPVLPHPAAAS